MGEIAVRVGVFLFFLWNVFLSAKLADTRASLEHKIWKLEFRLIMNGHLSGREFFENVQKPDKLDELTGTLPRMVVDGIFPLENSEFSKQENNGRKAGDLQDTAVILEVSDAKNVDRWLETLESQRKSPNDLQVVLFSSEIGYTELKESARKFKSGVRVVKTNTFKRAVSDAFSSGKDYAIIANDTDYAGADFADFYFLGKSLLKIDSKIGGICGGSFANFSSNPDMGDFFWLTDSPCPGGAMFRRQKMLPVTSTGDIIMMRPEVPRVADSPEKVTNNTWNIDFYTSSLLTIEEFERRLRTDLKNATPMKLWAWNGMDEDKTDTNAVYMFPFTYMRDLNHYFPNVPDVVKQVPFYKGIAPVFFGDLKSYVVPASTFRSRHIDPHPTVLN